jgi:hypothetical protein
MEQNLHLSVVSCTLGNYTEERQVGGGRGGEGVGGTFEHDKKRIRFCGGVAIMRNET